MCNELELAARAEEPKPTKQFKRFSNLTTNISDDYHNLDHGIYDTFTMVRVLFSEFV
jgi:hypothetical protein